VPAADQSHAAERREELHAAADEFVAAAHELAQAFSELRKCSCGKWTREQVCPQCGLRSDS
jgi:hypothetical protein